MMEILEEELVAGLVVAGRYELERVVGRGGMAVVWAARHTLTGKSFALKFLSTERASDLRSHERLFREARAACAVKHPNVAEVLDVLELDNGVPFLVMDLLEGETLAARLARRRRLDPDEARAIFLPIVEALAAAHAVGVVHRDLKPENVFLVHMGKGSEVVKVVDFGIAKVGATFEEASTTTNTGDLVGTPIYMAPEQVFGESDVDGRADVWALGIMLYEALAGAPPTAAPTLGQVLKAITREPIAPLSIAAPDAPPELADLTSRMLAQSREDRPTLEAIQRALASSSASLAAPPATSPPARAAPPAARPGTWLRGLFAVGAALALGLGGYLVSRPAVVVAPPPLADVSPVLASQAPAPPLAPEPPLTTATSARAPLVAPTATQPPTATALALPAAASVQPSAPRLTPSPLLPAESPSQRPDAGVILTHDRK